MRLSALLLVWAAVLAGDAAADAAGDVPPWAQAHGEGFAAAYRLYANASLRGYDYAPAIAAFSAAAGAAKRAEDEMPARFCLAISCLFGRQWRRAGDEAAALQKLAARLTPQDPRVLAAGDILRDAGLTSPAAVKEALVQRSRIRLLLPGEDDSKMLGISETAAALEFANLIARMQGPVFRKARERIAAPAGPGEEALCLALLKARLAGEEEDPHAAAVGAALGLLAPLAVPEDAGGVRDQASLVVCAANLEQIGLALLLYAADHEGLIPQLCPAAGSPTQEERTWCGLLMPYLGMERQVLPTGGWSGKPDLLEVLPPDSVFTCPARVHSWTSSRTRGAEYGLLDTISSGKVRYSQLVPAQQVLVTETPYNMRMVGGCVSPHAGLTNFLYADGHVEAHDAAWIAAHPWPGRAGPDNPWNTLAPAKQP